MVEDREVLREVWEGRIPTAFNLASEDVSTAISPETYYVWAHHMFSRILNLQFFFHELFFFFCSMSFKVFN
jgi:hypothetical protein